MEATLTDQCYLSALLSQGVYSAERRARVRLSIFGWLSTCPTGGGGLVYRRPWFAERWCVSWREVASVVDRIILKPGTVPTGTRQRIAHRHLRSSSGTSSWTSRSWMSTVPRWSASMILHVRQTDGKLRLAQVDVGFRGLLRRLGFEGPSGSVCKWFFRLYLKEKFIAWHYVPAPGGSGPAETSDPSEQTGGPSPR